VVTQPCNALCSVPNGRQSGVAFSVAEMRTIQFTGPGGVRKIRARLGGFSPSCRRYAMNVTEPMVYQA